MEQKHSIGWVTFLLAAVAGFCDTATFVAGDAIFSAHVTGNFIVFAAQVASGGSSTESWIKLISFPVFVLAVMVGGWLAEKTGRKYKILLIEGIILVCCGITAMLISAMPGVNEKISVYLIVMTTVFAMGLQNAFGKLFGKETYGPTTMMTGNVTQISLDLCTFLLRRGDKAAISSINSRNQLITIGGFLGGCILGAVLAKWVGLSAVILPGAAIVLCYLQGESAAQKMD
ncbi:YoaK family protein [Chitinophaga ginsengisoli]|uniref:Uncharacterized membrane protein YoaK (UPF0700 family) n=1 Tax=Chitinophaga ginsengisoli TaxID=363837 RepID=A0A2P8GAM8_9BACT|nr:YoaK family protein [Chitinophaga ginsengisoli]PSL31032.1 uncharacterized membrane protein YoaK (UPF0700 family) [Chitinophaga ginsengisoli]